MDQEFGEGAPQVYICLATLGMLGAGVWLEKRRQGRACVSAKAETYERWNGVYIIL